MYGHQDGNNSSLVGAIRRRSAPSLGSPPTPAPTTAHSPRSAPPGRSSRRKWKRAYVALWETKELEEEEAKEKAAAAAVLAVQQPAVLCIQSCFRRWQQRGAILALLPLAHQKAKARALSLARWLARLTCPGSSESVAAARIQEALQRRCALVQLRRSEAAAVRIQMAFRRQNSRRACARLRQAAAARAWAREESKEARKGLGNGIWNEGQLAETIEAASRGCRGCGSAPGLDFVLDHKRGVGDGCLRFRCAGCSVSVDIKRSKNVDEPDRRGAPASENTLRVINTAQWLGMGHKQLSTFLVGCNMPPVNQKTWALASSKAAAATEKSFEEMMAENLEEEKKMTLEKEGEAARGPSGKVHIRAMTDGSWQKRYGRNSLWGCGVMYGYYTGKPISAESRCARCVTCMSAAHRGAEVNEHTCTRTWTAGKSDGGSAGNMEKEIALSCVQNIYQKGVIVAVLICDGDTKTEGWIKERGPPEVAAVLTSMHDLNHISINLGKKVREIQGQGLTEGQCGALQRSFAAAVYQSREQSAAAEETEEAAATRMQKNIMAVPDHFYNKNNHEKCGDKCPAKSTNKEIFNAAHVPHATGKYLDPGQGDRYYNHVVSVFKTYSSPDIARKLTLACTTNTVECGNSLLWLFHLPKARFRPKTGERHLQDALLHKAMGNTAGLLAGAAGLGISQLSERNQAYALQMDEQSRR